MRSTFRFAMAMSILLGMTVPLSAQQPGESESSPADSSSAPKATAVDDATTAAAADAESSWKKGRPITMQYYRALDQRGTNVFETTKDPGVGFSGFKLDLGAAFASELQDFSHSNTAAPNIVSGVNTNQLANIGLGMNNPVANLYLNAQLAPGIRVALTSYLSSRHHNETWVKDGYIQIDQSPIDFAPLNALMEIMTVRVGDFEINYGDAHFRRSDNGQGVYNPFIGNYIMDAFTTQIGGEIYLKTSNIIAMGSITAGELQGTVLSPGRRSPSYIGKLGVDRHVTKDLRIRLTGSVYKTDRAMSDTLYGGDRAGSPYYYVLENTQATATGQADSGQLNPGFVNKVTAFQMNPFVKFRGLEVFGVLERAQGKATSGLTDRVWTQYAVDTVYRFLPDEKLFVGVRYNRAQGQLAGVVPDVGANRWEYGGGWFITPNVLAKAEYVNQTYFGFPVTDIHNGGVFKGLMLSGAIAF